MSSVLRYVLMHFVPVSPDWRASIHFAELYLWKFFPEYAAQHTRTP